MATVSTNSTDLGPMKYLSTSEEGKTPATVIAVGAVFSVLAGAVLALRFYCRLRVVRFRPGIDDWLMLAAFTLTLGLGLMLIVGAAIGGLAQPTPQGYKPLDYLWVTDDAEVITQKIFYVFMIVQSLSFGLAKLSVLFFYRRIFPSSTFRVLNMMLVVIVVIWTIAFFFANVFRCGTNFWARWAPVQALKTYCYDSTSMFYTLAIADVITDGLILSLPMYWIWKMNMSIAKRVAISGVFLLGAIEIGTGIGRLVQFVRQSTNYIQNADGIGVLTTMMFWSMIEMGIAIVAGCLPTIWPLIHNFSLEHMISRGRSVLSLENLRSGSDGSRHASKGAGRQGTEVEESYATGPASAASAGSIGHEEKLIV